MELTIPQKANHLPRQIDKVIPEVVENMEIATSKPFIEANTLPATLEQVQHDHIIPVFIKDNEPVISHYEFIDTLITAAEEVFHGEMILKPNIRLSHPIKGRIPEAKNKPAKELLAHEKTLYYERMAFIVEVPSIYTEIAGNKLHLTIGGVKAYNLDNLYNTHGADQHFKVFAGFRNMVCTNLCVSTDGYLSNLKVKNLDMLLGGIKGMLQEFNPIKLADTLSSFNNYQLSEQLFAQLVGRCRMYKYLPDNLKKDIPELLFGESQLNNVCNDYYRDPHFGRNKEGEITLWQLYNLFTGANKSSYIDTYLDRGLNAFHITRELQTAIQQKTYCWYLN